MVLVDLAEVAARRSAATCRCRLFALTWIPAAVGPRRGLQVQRLSCLGRVGALTRVLSNVLDSPWDVSCRRGPTLVQTQYDGDCHEDGGREEDGNTPAPSKLPGPAGKRVSIVVEDSLHHKSGPGRE